MMKTLIQILLISMFGMLLSCGLGFAQSDISFSGTLTEEPCTLAPEDSNIAVDFGTVINKTLYSDTRSLPQPFALHLVDCDTSQGNQVQVTFSGTEDSAQPGLLALDGSGAASGVAIGIEDQSGTLLPVNKPSSAFPLQDGNSAINLAAFVQASNTAIASHSIVVGDFSASATFEFTYN